MGCGTSSGKHKIKEPIQNTSKDHLDENFFSRQMAVYGAETQAKILKLSIFIQGMTGIGVEIAKNVILAGVASVTIHDDEICQQSDSGSNFYIQDKHIKSKQTRAQACVDQLKQLNPYCSVKTKQGEIISENLQEFNVVIFSNCYDKAKLIEFNAACRDKHIGFIYTGILGLYGFAFVDFGEKHKVIDNNGEEYKSTMIVSITQDKEAMVTTNDDKRHGLVDGDSVTFKEVQGMEEVNNQVFKVKVKSPYVFTIDQDTTKFKPYLRDGLVQQVKIPKEISFKSLAESLENPIENEKLSSELSDNGNKKRPYELHKILNGVLEYAQTNGNHLPQLLNTEDANKLAEIVRKQKLTQKNQQDEINEELVKNVSLFARAQISPLCSFWGGIVAQEILKFTGKLTPLHQWLHYDVFECLPQGDKVNKLVLQDSQQCDQIAIFGQEFQNILSKLNIFLVGAGALGCEYSKMFALMGIATDASGLVTVADDDNVQMANLNSQFLFRREHIGKSKSTILTKTVQTMNPSLKIKNLNMKVVAENEQYFNDTFWESLSFVVNAVDNNKSRLYIDNQCVWYEKPLFDSGIDGTKCHSQVILPNQTQSFGDSIDPSEESYPLCVLKNFPHQIEHTIQWAMDFFQVTFIEGIQGLSQFVTNPTEYLKKLEIENTGKSGMLRLKLETLQNLAETLVNRGTMESCIKLARKLFEENFKNQIVQLLHSFPLSHVTEDGQPFWSGHKRPPIMIDFNAKDDIHLEFIQASANIIGFAFGLQKCNDREEIKGILKDVKIEQFVPGNIKINVNPTDNTGNVAEDDEQICARIVQELKNLKIPANKKIQVIQFNHDDPTNYHIDLIASVANLRARNYKIEEVDKFKVRMIAGKIIPSLATTTAMIVGAVGIEIIKYILKKPLNLMKNSFMNSALPQYIFSNPVPPIQKKDKEYDEVMLGPVKAIPSGFTNWDKIAIKGPMTLQDLLNYFVKQYQVNLQILSVGKTCIFNFYSQEGKAERLALDIASIYEKISKETISKSKKFLEITASGEFIPEGVDVIMPIIKYQFK